MRFLREFFSTVSQPINLPYASTRIALAIFFGLLLFGAFAYVNLVAQPEILQVFEQYGLHYDVFMFIADVITYMFAVWLAWEVCDMASRIHVRLFGNMLVDTPKESQVVWYLTIVIFVVVMLLTIQLGWLYFTVVPLLVILLPGIIKRTLVQEKKIGVALLVALCAQVIPLVLVHINTLFAFLAFLTICDFMIAFLCFAVGKKKTGMAALGLALGCMYYTYLIYTAYTSAHETATMLLLSYLMRRVKPELFMVGFTPLHSEMIRYAQQIAEESFSGLLYPFILLLFLAIAGIPEELLCRSVIPRIGVYLTSLIFGALHIPSRLASVMMPFASMIMPLIASVLVVTIFLIALPTAFILAAYRSAGLLGSIMEHACYDTLVTLYAYGLTRDIITMNLMLLAGLVGYAVMIKILRR